MSFGALQKYLLGVVLALLVGPLPLRLSAQGTAATGTLRGQVTDPSGSALGTATVIVTTPGGDAITANTNRDGIYEVKNLAPGRYGVKIIAQGFTEFDSPTVEITGGQLQKLDARLNIQTQAEKVMVTDEAGTSLDVNPASNAGAVVLQGKDL